MGIMRKVLTLSLSSWSNTAQCIYMIWSKQLWEREDKIWCAYASNIQYLARIWTIYLVLLKRTYTFAFMKALLLFKIYNKKAVNIMRIASLMELIVYVIQMLFFKMLFCKKKTRFFAEQHLYNIHIWFQENKRRDSIYIVFHARVIVISRIINRHVPPTADTLKCQKKHLSNSFCDSFYMCRLSDGTTNHSKYTKMNIMLSLRVLVPLLSTHS